MTEKKLFRTMQVEPTRENYAAIACVIMPALRTVLEDMVRKSPNGDYGWFDKLETNLIRDAKGTVIEGFPIQVEAAALKAGIDVLQTTLDIVRHTLIDKKAD